MWFCTALKATSDVTVTIFISGMSLWPKAEHRSTLMMLHEAIVIRTSLSINTFFKLPRNLFFLFLSSLHVELCAVRVVESAMLKKFVPEGLGR